MIVIQLNGSVGNQLFQYAAARNFSMLYNCRLFIDYSWFEENRKKKVQPTKVGIAGFNIEYQLAGTAILNQFLKVKSPIYQIRNPEIKGCKIIDEKGQSTLAELFNTNPPFFMRGNFNSEMYFKESEQVIRNELTPQSKYVPVVTKFKENLRNKENVAVCILLEPSTQFTENDILYFKYAIRDLLAKIKNPLFHIFSNVSKQELAVITADLKRGQKLVHKLYTNEHAWLNIYLMSLCEHFIVNNSSDSWWILWMGKKENSIVFYPDEMNLKNSMKLKYLKTTHIPK